jgi:tripartite-type tricarboxylate transporter receptor subunit TctC
VTGYPGTQAMFLSMERGETQGRVGSWYSFKLGFPEAVRNGSIVVLAQDGLERNNELAQVPLYHELVSEPEAKAILELTSVPGIISRTLAFPPGVPEDRVDAVRRAFEATTRDPLFLQAAEKAKLEIHPSGHEKIEAVLARLFATPPDVVARTKSILGWK